MTLLRPCRGVIQLFTLEAGEITTGEMQQIAIEGNHACAVAGQRFVHQVIVVLIARARVQAHHAIGIPATVPHKATQEVVAPGDAVDGIRLRCSQHLLDGLLQFRGNTLVGVDHQDIVASGKLLRALALDAVALPVGIDIDLHTGRAGDLHRGVGAAGIKQNDLIGPHHGGEAIWQQVSGVFGDHDDRQARRH